MRRFAAASPLMLVTFVAGICISSIWPTLKSQEPANTIAVKPFVSRTNTSLRVPEPIPINQSEEYPDVLHILRQLASAKGKKRKNSFYVAKVKSESVTYLDERIPRLHQYTYVYWKEDRSLIRLDFALDPNIDDLYERFRVNLKTDVVPTGKYENLGCCLVEQNWVDGVLKDCLSEGYRIIISKAGLVIMEQQFSVKRAHLPQR